MSDNVLAVVSLETDPPAKAQLATAKARLGACGWRQLTTTFDLELWAPPGAKAVAVWHAAPGMLVLGWRREAVTSTEDGGRGPSAWARALCASGWGGYLALLRDPAGAWQIFRDPSGSLEAFSWRRGAVGFLATSLTGLPPALLPRHLSLDWDAVSDFVLRPTSLAAGSALRGIEAVSPGDLQPLGAPAAAAAPIWRPAYHAARGARSDLCEACLREVVTDTVNALAEPYSRLAVEVSGGLDSSIVAASLAAGGLGGRVALALNYAGDRREGDEQVWAEALCARWDLPLSVVGRPLEPFDPERAFPDLVDDARPPVAALDPWRDRDAAARLAATGADALLTGVGGDAVLFQMPSAAVASDLFGANGARALLDPRLADVARWLRCSAWSLWAASRRAVPSALGPPTPFAGPRPRNDPPRAEHPWLTGLEDLPKGKQLQVRMLAATLAMIGRRRVHGAAAVLHPLLAQPVMEHCLAIPSWELVRGGRDRGLARQAFRDLLPSVVAERRSKGTLTAFYARSLAAGLDKVRPYLLEGVLADAGVLDRDAMNAALRPESLIVRPDALSLIRVSAVEAWVRHWQTRIPDAADAPRHRL